MQSSLSMSPNRSPGKHQTDKVREGECDSRAPSSPRDPLCSSSGGLSPSEARHPKPRRTKYERPPTSNLENTHPDKPRPKSSRPKSSRPLTRDNAGQNSSDEGQKREKSIEKKPCEAERRRRQGHASLHTDDGEDAKSKSASPTRKRENKTPSSATSRPSTLRPRWRSTYADSNPQPHVLQSDLRKGNNYYLYCLGKIYDVSDMRRKKEMQYWNLLARQRQLGFHSPKEYEVYTRYLSRPRTAEHSRTYPGRQRTKSTEGRRGEERDKRSRTASAADGKERTLETDDERADRELSGDCKGMAVSSKTRAASSKPRAASSKLRTASSKPRTASSKSRAASSKPRAASSKEDQREAGYSTDVSRDKAEEEEIKRLQNEKTDEESDTSKSDEEKTRNNQNLDSGRDQSKPKSRSGRDQRRGNSPSGRDQGNTEDEQEPRVSLSPKAAESGNESERDETLDDKDESDVRIISESEADSEDNRPVDATANDRRTTDVASFDDSDTSVARYALVSTR